MLSQGKELSVKSATNFKSLAHLPRSVQGKIGERYAWYVLSYFFDLLEENPDIGTDKYGTLRNSNRASVVFGIQTKTAKEYRLKYEKVSQYLKYHEHQGPYVFCWVTLNWQKNKLDVVKYATMWDWISLDGGESLARICKSTTPRKTIRVPQSLFRTIDAPGEDFYRAMRTEEERWAGGRGHILAPSTSPSVPVSGNALPRIVGRCSRIETTKEALEAAKALSFTSTQMSEYLNSELTRAENRTNLSGERLEWAKNAATQPSTGEIATEALHVRNFLKCVDRFNQGEPYEIPRYSWGSNSVWRILLQIFPQAIQLFERYMKHGIGSGTIPKDIEQFNVMSILNNLSAIARTSNDILGDRAKRIIKAFGNEFRVDTFRFPEEYPLARQYHFARAEAEGGNHVGQALGFSIARTLSLRRST